MKLSTILTLTAFVTLNVNAADKSIYCSNAPQSTWKSYYCFSGTLNDKKNQFSDGEWGICEGSSDAGESEPVKIVEYKKVGLNNNLRASSAAWKDALPFDLSNATFGEAVLYIHSQDLEKEEFTVRLKVEKAIEGLATDVKLTCRQ